MKSMKYEEYEETLREQEEDDSQEEEIDEETVEGDDEEEENEDQANEETVSKRGPRGPSTFNICVKEYMVFPYFVFCILQKANIRSIFSMNRE